ncbi:MAG TPA: PepSY domain-containing protein [Xanthobacteraceae bacterium]|nr:PepSY domain-containing protein [Xanthobacteraceae bacterium]
MRINVLVMTAALVTGFGGSALADRNLCPSATGQHWMPIEKVIEKAESLGYAVREAKRSKGCWEIEGFDRNGAEIEILLNPFSGDVVKPRDWLPPPRHP